ncbi:MAG: LytTR family transcriptional regulator [Bacteroidetes bacterium]|nr:LytTR family transcriptional regulator [Bacteroidota bacterium]
MDPRFAEFLASRKSPTRKIALPVSNGYTFVHVDDIQRCEGAAKYTEVYHKNGKALSSKSIGYFAEILKPFGFFLTHRSHLVNLDFVDSYTFEGEIILQDGTSVPLSRRRKTAFIKQFE